MEILQGVNVLHEALDYHLARHNLLTSNLAHVDTPGYRPLDLDRRNGFARELNAAMVRTDPHHAGPTGTQRSFRVFADRVATPTEDGNAVSIDRETVKIAANHVRYQVLSQMTAGSLRTMAWAARDGRDG